MPGSLSLEDGRYLDRQDDLQRVLVIETEGGLPPARRRRRKPRKAGPDPGPASVPVTVLTAIRSHEPFESDSQGSNWLRSAEREPELVDRLLVEAEALLDRALAADAAASGRPYSGPPPISEALRCRIGFADGDRISEGRFIHALDIDIRGGESARRKRADRIRPLERTAAILGQKVRADACEYLIPRVRTDLDAGRLLPAALGLDVAVRATIVELDLALQESDHEADIDRLEAALPGLEEIRNRALTEMGAWPGLERELEEPLAIAERVLRRRRIATQ